MTFPEQLQRKPDAVESNGLDLHLAMTDECARRRLGDLVGSCPRFRARDLFRLAAKNPVVQQFVALWENGELASLEQMLLGLTILLARQNEQLIKDAVKADIHSTRTFRPTPGTILPTSNPVAEQDQMDKEQRPMTEQQVADSTAEVMTKIGSILGIWVPGSHDSGLLLAEFLQDKAKEIRNDISDDMVCGVCDGWYS